MNHVALTGNLAQEIELHTTGNGNNVTTINLAVQSDYYKAGEESKAEFISVTVWGKQAEACATNLVKGQHIEVEGRLQHRSYEKNGEKHYATEVIAEKIKFGAKPTHSKSTSEATASPKSKAKKSA